MWIGGRQRGQGHKGHYGIFRGEEKCVWLAHRWAAAYIHGFEITGLQVDHCCPCGSHTLCVQHVQPESAERNRYLQHTRPGRGYQDVDTKRSWVHVQVGLRDFEPVVRVPDAVPFFSPPAWLLPFLPMEEIPDDACPF
jgi:hypothetical protein